MGSALGSARGSALGSARGSARVAARAAARGSAQVKKTLTLASFSTRITVEQLRPGYFRFRDNSKNLSVFFFFAWQYIVKITCIRLYDKN
jgi:hypothetical protein